MRESVTNAGAIIFVQAMFFKKSERVTFSRESYFFFGGERVRRREALEEEGRGGGGGE